MTRPIVFLIAVLGTFNFAVKIVCAGTSSIVSIAAIGDPVPSANRFQYQLFFGPHSIVRNNLGQTLYTALIKSNELSTTGLFLHSPQGTRIVLLSADRVPGIEGSLNIFDPTQIDLNDNGSVVFAAAIDTGGVEPQYALVLYRDGRFVPLASSGSIPIGSANRSLRLIATVGLTGTNVSLNNLEQCVFAATLDDGNTGIFVATEHSLNTYAVSRQTVVGSAQLFDTFRTPRIDNSGKIKFVGRSGLKYVLLESSAGSITELGVSTSDKYELAIEAFNNSGNLVAVTTIVEAKPWGRYRAELILATPASFQTVAAIGTKVPPDEIVFLGNAAITDDNDVIFIATAQNDSLARYRGLFKEDSNGLASLLKDSTYFEGLGGTLLNLRAVSADNNGGLTLIGTLRPGGGATPGKGEDGIFSYSTR